MSRLRQIFLAVFLGGNWGLYADICDIYKEYAPALYDINCGGSRGGGTARPKSAGSTFSDAFNLNPAQTPTHPTPYGVEGMGHFFQDAQGNFRWGYGFGVVKGFKRVGTGVSTAATNSFFGDDIVGRLYHGPKLLSFDPTETPDSRYPNLNLGSSVALLEGKLFSLSVGGAARFNRTTATWGWGSGAYLSLRRFSLGYGLARETFSHFLPTTYFHNAMASVKIWWFEFEYDYLFHSLATGLKPIQIGVVSLVYERMIASLGARNIQFRNYGYSTQYTYSFQYQFNAHFVLGYIHNYIPDSHTIATQFFF